MYLYTYIYSLYICAAYICGEYVYIYIYIYANLPLASWCIPVVLSRVLDALWWMLHLLAAEAGQVPIGSTQ